MNFTEALNISQANLVYLVRAKEKYRQKAAWYYIKVDKMKVPIFKKKIKGNFNLLEFGQILYSGWGENPSEDIKRKVEEEYR